MLKNHLHLKIYFLLLLFSICSFSISAQISGKVTSTEGDALIGVSIIVKGTTVGTISDVEGNYQINAGADDILVFSYTGMLPQELTANGSRLDVQLAEDVTTLNDVVITATRQPVRKIATTTAINVVSMKELLTTQPESFTEAIENTPGVSVNNAQGRKGVFTIRGFPGGNIYTTTLMDGLPVSGIANLSAGTQEFYGFDHNVERIEVVRGAAATLFGRSAGAGAVNIISRTGGAEHGGSAAITKYNNVSEDEHQFSDNFDFRADLNFNGPITDKLRYNVGGYIINDAGNKEQANKDKGAQVRGNFDYLISKNSTVRLSAGYLDNEFQNITDAPWDLTEEKPGAGFSTANTFYNDASQIDNPDAIAASSGEPILDANGNQIKNNPADNKERAWGGFVGLDLNIDLGDGWSVVEKLKYQSLQWNDINEFSFSGFYTAESSIFRFNGGAKQQNSSFISETRIQKFIESGNAKHNISAGIYFADAERDRLGLNYTYFSTVSTRPVFSGFGGSPLGSTFSISGTTSHREEKSTGIFIGDEMVFNDKLSVNVAVRYDWLDASFSNDPNEIRSIGVDYNPAMETKVELEFGDFSGSIGANYLIGESSAVYANFLRAFSLPSVTNVNAIEPEDNEIINNLELGYRAGFGDLSVDITGFYTRINNRVSSVFDSQLIEFISRPSGSNKILGSEIAVIFAPTQVKGLVIRGSVTLQNSEYVDFEVPLSKNRTTGEINADLNNLFGLKLIGEDQNLGIDVAGNQVQRTPKAIYNVNIGYSSKSWGADFGGFTYAGINPDVFNLWEQPNLSIYNLGGYYKYSFGGSELKLSLRVKNLFDFENPQELLLSSGDDSSLLERQRFPDSTGRLAFATLQNPRRILVTLGYTF